MFFHTVGSLFILFLFYFIYLFWERGEGREKEREKHPCVVASCTPLLGTWPATQTGALTGNWTGYPLVHRPALDPLSHTSKGSKAVFISFLKANLASHSYGFGKERSISIIFKVNCDCSSWTVCQRSPSGSSLKVSCSEESEIISANFCTLSHPNPLVSLVLKRDLFLCILLECHSLIMWKILIHWIIM